MDEINVITVSGSGRTEPHIESGTGVVLVREGKASVGRWIKLNEDDFYIKHPENEEDLSEEANSWVIQNDEKILKSDIDKVLLCPEWLNKKMIWRL